MFQLDLSTEENFSNALGDLLASRSTTTTKTTSSTPLIDSWKTTTISPTKTSGGTATTTMKTTSTSSTPLLDKLKAQAAAKKTSSPSTPSGGGGGGGGMPEPSAGDETEQAEVPQMNEAGMMPSFKDPKVLGAIGGGILAYMLVPEKYKMLGIILAMGAGYILMGKVKPQDIKDVKEKVQEKVKEKINEVKK